MKKIKSSSLHLLITSLACTLALNIFASDPFTDTAAHDEISQENKPTCCLILADNIQIFDALVHNNNLYEALDLLPPEQSDIKGIKDVTIEGTKKVNIETVILRYGLTHNLMVIAEKSYFPLVINVLQHREEPIVHSIITFNPQCSEKKRKAISERNYQRIEPDISIDEVIASETEEQKEQSELMVPQNEQKEASKIQTETKETTLINKSALLNLALQGATAGKQLQNVFELIKKYTLGSVQNYGIGNYMPLNINFSAIKNRLYNFYSLAESQVYHKIIPAGQLDPINSDVPFFKGVNVACYHIGTNNNPVPFKFEEYYITRYCKNFDERIIKAIQEANQNYKFNTDLACVLSTQEEFRGTLATAGDARLIPSTENLPYLFINHFVTTIYEKNQTTVSYFIDYAHSLPMFGNWAYYWRSNTQNVDKNYIETQLKRECDFNAQQIKKIPYCQTILSAPKNSVVKLLEIINNFSQFPDNPSLVQVKQPARSPITVSESLELCADEREAVTQRKSIVEKSLEQLTGQKNSKTPIIALVASGGGIRAMLATLGALKGFERAQLIDTVMYISCLSGSTWAVAQWMHSKGTSIDFIEPIQHALEKAPAGFVNIMNVFSKSDTVREILGIFPPETPQKFYFSRPYTLIDIWAKIIYNQMLGYTTNVYLTLSSQADKIKSAHVPIPIYTAVSYNCLRSDQRKVPGREAQYNWVEFSPYQIGWNDNKKRGKYVPAWAFGREFHSGISQDYAPEEDVKLLLGLWGSAISIPFAEYATPVGLRDVIPTSLKKIRASSGKYFNPTYQLKNDYNRNVKHIRLVDAGIDFNLPYPPISGDRPARKADIIIFIDASGDFEPSLYDKNGNQSIASGRELTLVADYARHYGHPFPSLNGLNPIAASLQIFNDQANPHSPIVVYAPLTKIVSDVTQASNKTLEIDNTPKTIEQIIKEDNQGMTNLLAQLFDAKNYSTFNFQYSIALSSNLVALMELNILINKQKIMDAIKQWYAKQPLNPRKETQPKLAKITLKKKHTVKPIV